MGGRPKDTLESIQQNLDSRGREITISGEYVNQKTKLNCTCNLCHHNWIATASNLKSNDGKGCVYCSRGVIRSLEHLQDQLDSLGKNFTLIAESVKKYHYDVRCNMCQREWTTSSTSILTCGCARCNKKIKGSLENTQNKLNNRFSMIQVSGVYVNAYSKLNCLCQICGTQWSAHSHNLLNNNRGCPSCARTGYDPSKPGILYYLRVQAYGETYWKIGITNLSVQKRFSSEDLEKITIIFEKSFQDGRVAQQSESNILKLFSEYRADGVKVLKSGNTELFTKDVLQMNHLLTDKNYVTH